MVLAIPNSSALDAGGAAKARKTHNTRLRGACTAVGIGIALGGAGTYYSKSSARFKQRKLLQDDDRFVQNPLK